MSGSQPFCYHVSSKYLFVTQSTTKFIKKLILWIYLNANGNITYDSCSLSVFPAQVALRATTTLTTHQESWEGHERRFWLLVLILIVANSSPQIVFLANICFDFAKFAANVFSYVVFLSLQTRLAAPFRSLHNVHVLPSQPSCNNFAFFTIFFMYRLSVVTPN